MEQVPTVRETVHGLLRRWGMTTIFGNPGSNELPFLHEFPDDFDYVLGLYEAAVLGMADGYAQATGRPALVNLHAAAGLGHAMGALGNARAAGTPLVVTVGQQHRALVGLGAMLGEPGMTRVPEPFVKSSVEPTRAEDVPRAFAHAVHLASLPPTGPVFLSLPWDDWASPVDPDEVAHLGQRRVRATGAMDAGGLAALRERLAQAAAPVLVVGPELDVEPAFDDAVRLAEAARLPVWIAPSPPRCPFPTTHPNYRGVLPNSVAGVSSALAGHDLVLVLGAPVFRYHVHQPGPLLEPDARLVLVTADPDRAARAPVGDAVVADPVAVVAELAATATAPQGRPEPAARTAPSPAPVSGPPFAAEAVFDALAAVLPDDAVLVDESTSNTAAFWARVPMRRAGSLLFPAAGGLGFGLPAAVGAAMAHRGRPVVAVLGDGAVQYAVTGLWTAAQRRLPVTFLVLRNDEYGALRWFKGPLGVHGVPGLDLPGIDVVSIAEGYGVPAHRIGCLDELAAGVSRGTGPRLLEIPVAGAGPGVD